MADALQMNLTCPRCGCNSVRPSILTGAADYLYLILLLGPYRCRKCRYRFHRYIGHANDWTSTAANDDPARITAAIREPMPRVHQNGIAHAGNGVAYPQNGTAHAQNGLAHAQNGGAHAQNGIVQAATPVPSGAPMCKLIFARPSSVRNR
jgi:hypothetical protein